MNLRLARILKLHGLYCAPADDGEGVGSGGGEGADAVDGADADDGTEGDGKDAEGADDADPEAKGAGEDADEVVITIGDEKAEEDADDLPDDATPEQRRTLVKDLRKKLKLQSAENKRMARELQEVKTAGTTQQAAVEVGPEPEVDDYETWTEEGKSKFKADWAAWNTRKQKADEQQRVRAENEERARTQWQATLNDYKKAGAALKVRDFSEAEDAARDVLSVMQQGIILQAFDAKVAAQVVYAIGKSPKRAAELAAIKDPVKFAVAVTKLETELKVTPRKAAPPPERRVQSSVGGAAAVDSELKRLEEQADKTGDRTQVARYLREKQKQAA